MKKTFTKIVAGITAAAALLITAGCKNQLDYVNDTTDINVMKIAGFKVTGIDSLYDKKTIVLKAVVNGTDQEIARAVLCESSTDANYQSGSAFKKLDTPYVYDGDTNKTSKFECYLDILNADDVSIAKVQVPSSDYSKQENAKLTVVSSPAKTADADLASRYVVVTVLNGATTFEWSRSPDKPSYFAMPQIQIDMSADAEGSLPTGFTITTTAKSGTHPKYTVKFTGLVANKGEQFVVAGASICSAADGTPGDNWNIMETAGKNVSGVVTDKGLISKVDDNGEITFTFYGENPSWDKNAHKGPAIKIAKYNVDQAPWVCLIAGPNNGNYFFPSYCDGKDVTMTVDGSKYMAAAGEECTFYVDAIEVVNAPALGTAGYLAFCADWLPDNLYNKATTNKIKADAYDTNGNAWFVPKSSIAYTPATDTTSLDIQILDPVSDDTFRDNTTKVCGGTVKTPSYESTTLTGTHYVLVISRYSTAITAAGVATLVPTSFVTDFPVPQLYIHGNLVDSLWNAKILTKKTGSQTYLYVADTSAAGLNGTTAMFKITTATDWNGTNYSAADDTADLVLKTVHGTTASALNNTSKEAKNMTFTVEDGTPYLITVDTTTPSAMTISVENLNRYIHGNLVDSNWNAKKLTYVNETTQTFEYTADTSAAGLNGTSAMFKITTATDWNGTNYSAATDAEDKIFTLGTAYALSNTSGGAQNNKITVEDGVKYLFTVDFTNLNIPVVTITKE